MTNLDPKLRVKNSEVLSEYEDIIFADWNEGEEHDEWVATAPESEIAEWAASIRHDEETLND